MMHETEYAYAVARVRANELTLLSASDIEQLISAGDYEAAMRRLADLGWGEIENIADYSKYIENYSEKTWELLSDVLPEKHDLDMLLIRNDMQNLKAALKCIVSQHDPEELFVSPTVYDIDETYKLIQERKFDSLPLYMQKSAKEAYDILVRSGNGQLADAVLDKATLEIMIQIAKDSGCPMLVKLSELICLTAGIKTALRCAKTGKDREFINNSICECSLINKMNLVSAAIDGVDSVLDYLSKTGLEKCVEAFNKSTSSFEKWCDDLIMECIKDAKFKAFGVEPLVAYYLAKDAEIKTVRIILSAKVNHLSPEVIKERVRALYV